MERGNLVLKIDAGQAVMIGDDIEVAVVKYHGGGMRLAIRAPKNLRVHRREVFERLRGECPTIGEEGK